MYHNCNYHKLISNILNGDKLAAKEFIKRHHERAYILNPIVGPSNNPLFQLIVRYRLTAIALDFIVQGVEVNTRDKSNMTPLHEAAVTGDIILVKELIKNGADPFACNEDGNTPEILAARSGYKELALRLSTSFLSKYPNYWSSRASPNSENQDEPLDLSKTGPYATVKPSFFMPNKPSRLFAPEKVTIDIDPEYVFEVSRFTS